MRALQYIYFSSLQRKTMQDVELTENRINLETQWFKMVNSFMTCQGTF